MAATAPPSITTTRSADRKPLRRLRRSGRDHQAEKQRDGQGGGADSNDHTTMHVLGHNPDFSELFTYAGSGYDSFF